MDIKQLRELEAKDSDSGTWYVKDMGNGWPSIYCGIDREILGNEGQEWFHKEGTHNASDYVFEIYERIAAYRNAIPYLLAVVEAAEGLLIDAKHNQHGMAPLSPLIKALSDFRNAK